MRAHAFIFFALAMLTRHAHAQGARPVTAPSASAQPASANTPAPGDISGLRLVPVDPGTEDVSNLWTGGRQLPVDMRTPLNFDRVYRVEGDLSKLGVLGVTPQRGESMYARASGGLLAIFPRSEYVRTRTGVTPVVPASTTFVLGSLASPSQTTARNGESTGSTAASVAQRVNLRADAVAPSTEPTQPAAARAPATIWTSEVARRSRLAALLDEAKAVQPTAEPANTDPESAPAPAQEPAAEAPAAPDAPSAPQPTPASAP